MVSRYGPVKQEGICLMPPPPHQYRMLPPQRTDGYHVATQQAYVQQPPPNQGNNQVPPLRGMPPTGPPNQASTPPNTDIKLQMPPPQQSSMNVAFVSQIPAQNYIATRAPQPTTQSARMANHRQGQQHMFSAQPQYVPMLPQSVQYISPPTPYYNGAQGPRPQQYVTAPFPMISGPAYTAYPAAQTQPATFLYGSQPMLQRPPFTSVTTVQQNPTQPTATQLPLPPPPQSWPSKKRLHAIPIIDPNTGKGIELNEQDDSHPPSGDSSARQTPQPPVPNNSKEVQAAFARQVTEAIKDVEMPIEEFDTSSVMEPINSHMFSVPPQGVSHQRYDSIIQSSKLQVATKEFIPAALHTAKETTPVVSAITDAVEVTITNKPKDRESPSKGRKPREQTNIIVKESINIKEKEDETISEKLTIVIEDENKPIDSIKTNTAPSKEYIATNLEKQISQKEELSNIPEPNIPIAIEEETKQEEDIPEAVTSSNLDADAKNKQSITTTKKKELPKQAQPVPQTTQSYPQPHITTQPVPVVQKVIQPSPVPVSQPTKPNNKTNKMREINIKGALKEGTDMDAFNDNTIEQNNITNITKTELYSDYVNNDNSTVLNNNEDANKNNDITTTNQLIKPILETKTKGKFDVMDIVKDTPKPIKPLLPTLPVESSDEVDRAVLANEKLVQAKNEVNAKVNANMIIDTNLQDLKLNLQYEDDQWSPANQNGQKVYGPELLLALREHPKSKVKPENMNIPPDLWSSDRARNDMNRYAGGGRQNDFNPSFGNIQGNKNSSRGGLVKRKSQQGPVSSSINKTGNRPSVIRVSISVKEDVKLKEVENAWRPARFVTGENMTEDDKKTEILYKKVRSVLNKLTPQKFTQLLDQVKNFQIDTTERLQGVIDLVFEKAVDEPNFSVAYANLCKEISSFTVPKGEVKIAEKESMETVNFRKLLLTRCQLEFEKNSIDEAVRNTKIKEIELCEDVEKKKEMELDLEEYDRRLRLKSVGNIRFIGELFKQNMLTVNIMVRCLNHLIADKGEESLECLCKLTSTVGQELEGRNIDLNSIFGIMKEIVEGKHKKISSRVRFMIQDVIDLRQSQWVPRRQDFNPKTMDQIQKDAENEQLVIQAMNSAPTPRKDDRLMSGGPIHNNERKTRRNVNNDEWQTPQSSRNRTSSQITVNSDKLKIQTPQTDEPFGNIQMFAEWSGGSKAKSSIPNSNNMYFALSDNASDIENRKSKMNIRSHNKDTYNSKGPSLEGNYRSYEDGRGSRSGSQHRSRDNSASHRSAQLSSLPPTTIPPTTYVPPRVPAGTAPRDQPPVVSAVVELTPEQFKTQLKKILEDYLTDSDINLCDTDIRKLCPISELPNIVTEGYNSVLEKSKIARWGTGQLFAKLIVLGTLSVDHYCSGLTDILSGASDLIIDIPKLWDYLGELIAPVICEGVFTMKDLHKCAEELIGSHYASKLLISLFNLIIQEKGPVFLNSVWQNSGVPLTSFMPESEIDSFITHNKFECLLHADSTTSYKSNSVLTQQEIYDKLVVFIRKNASFDDIVNWITANVGEDGVQQPAFLRSLATAVFGECIVHDKFKADIFKNKLNLMQRYINSQPSLELQCLYAIQTLSCKLEYPSGLLLTIFDKIYEESLISLESFLAWEISTDPSEQEGKGVALKQLTSFFIQLKEGEDDDDDDSCGSLDETGG